MDRIRSASHEEQSAEILIKLVFIVGQGSATPIALTQNTMLVSFKLSLSVVGTAAL